MIVLDEQLLGRDIEKAIAQWYRGTICWITDLRPQTIIKDDAIPHLLRPLNNPTFVTINEQDFWGKIAITRQFCVVCFAFPDSRAGEVPRFLRSVFRLPEFHTRTKRMGSVIRVTSEAIRYYTFKDRKIKTISFDLSL